MSGPYAGLSASEARAVLDHLPRSIEEPPSELTSAMNKLREAVMYDDDPILHKAFKEPMA